MIPPDDIDVSQEAYREVMDYRERVADRAISVESIRAEADTRAAEAVATDGGLSDTKRTLWTHFFDHDDALDAESRAVIETSFEHVVDDEFDEAAQVLRERFESVCERQNPALQNEAHPAACHLYEQPDRQT